MTKNLYVDVHVLQTVPSSNINRDDTGAPKTAIYGGVTRSRVSSQSWKRAIRTAFEQESKEAEWLKSYRTQYGVKLLAEELRKQAEDLSEEEAVKKAVAVFTAAGIKAKKDKKKGNAYVTGALLMLSQGQLEKLAAYALNNDDLDKKALKKLLTNDNSLDLALFGRMVADDPTLNVDAACQVAHAISTHEIIPEFDYYTALDDKPSEEQKSGSAMLGTIDYNSSTLYRYANININELVHNLNSDLAIKGVELFIKDFVLSMPTGKQNTFANKTVPKYVLVEVRDDTPVNLVSAFEDPVKTTNNGYVEQSINRLEHEDEEVLKLVDQPLLKVVLKNNESKLENQADNLSALVDQVANKLSEVLTDEDAND